MARLARNRRRTTDRRKEEARRRGDKMDKTAREPSSNRMQAAVAGSASERMRNSQYTHQPDGGDIKYWTDDRSCSGETLMKETGRKVAKLIAGTV
ncbi:unnamed protein product [Soboliphyme baturini]|uniref:DUF2945 domain-containing protein n=1 Tax=Soboliphyme baturini TaxID=241478 RepID=A0A183ISS6_9BILA|nr:unnamed protein product [Soboliphyme baturini]